MGGVDVPAFHATLNATSAACLTAGWRCIRAKRIAAHACCMIGAAVASSVFLVSYVLYHARVGSVPYQGAGWSRAVYFVLLIVHAILAVVIVPLAARTLWLAARKQFSAHQRIARATLPLWLIVCITGLLVYWLLYHVSAAEACPGCKEALFEPGQLSQRLSTAKGFALSIMLLLAVPVALVGGLTLRIVSTARRHRHQRQEGSG
ncbi:MAG: DUF420 domain-containing protein [Candidatus Omnitrophica bacterium]|nr:DUF420 domain-containing protein [Candidatus Omnitrophota bacterium]